MVTVAVRAKVRKMVMEAKTLQEMERLEQDLKEGKVAGGATDRALQGL